jgi:3-hydroxybutyryl-CoA dehydrogenase
LWKLLFSCTLKGEGYLNKGDIFMERIAILGSGTMGHSISLSFALADINVKVYGINDGDIAKTKEELAKNLSSLETHELITQTQKDEIQQKIQFSTLLEEVVNQATFIIEAVPEKLAIKHELYKKLNKIVTKDVVLASNTSGFKLQQLTAAYDYPNNFVITHFWNPAHLIPLVEIVKNDSTNEETIERTKKVLTESGKKPITINKEIQGFIGNRLQFAMFREAQHLLDAGVASKEDIDAAVSYSVGRRYSSIGPLMTADLGGLDTFSAIADYLFEDLNNDGKASDTLANLVDNGNLGYKTGHGFYDWSENEQLQDAIKKRDATLIHFLKEDKK